MKKVGIVTLCVNDNYGNKLQNYALKKVIEEYEFEVHTIWNESSSNSNCVKKIVKLIIKRIKKFKRKNLLVKEKRFKEFSKKYLNNDYRVRISNNLKKIEDDYDFFIVGSDQVWNFKYMNDYDLFFLNKIDKSKCLNYAPSFGVNDIPNDYDSLYSTGLGNFKYLSVREEQGKEIIKKIINRDDVEVLVDPTMLLNSQKWNEIEKKPNRAIPTKYIITYFLGKICDKRKKEFLELSKKFEYDIINIMDENDDFYVSSPEEFLYLIHNAEIVLTDSFHACVFSILYDRTFIVFDRDYNGLNINSRIDTLLSKLKITDSKYNEELITDKNLKHDYTEAYKILNEERRKSRDYLKKVLEII